RTGMNCSLCALATDAAANSAMPNRATLTAFILLLLTIRLRNSGTSAIVVPVHQRTDRDQSKSYLPASTAQGVLQCNISAETAIAAVFPCRSARAARGRGARRSGRR